MCDPACKRCGSAQHARNGVVRGHQRYRCRDCGLNVTVTARRGKPAAMKAAAVLMYAKGNMSRSSSGRLLG